PRYRDKAASLSALVNKVLASKELLPTSEHSLYSLRHTFEDRLTAVEAPEKVIAWLMGHKWVRPKYGAGPSLAQKRERLQKIAFTPPGRM
ncbi:integrase, partial [Mesorhizobium sp. M4B.F.Ca.ET.214.01.1.1]